MSLKSLKHPVFFIKAHLVQALQLWTMGDHLYLHLTLSPCHGYHGCQYGMLGWPCPGSRLQTVLYHRLWSVEESQLHINVKSSGRSD